MTDGMVRWRILTGVSLLFTAWMIWEGVTGFSLANNLVNNSADTVIPLATLVISETQPRRPPRQPAQRLVRR